MDSAEFTTIIILLGANINIYLKIVRSNKYILNVGAPSNLYCILFINPKCSGDSSQ